MRNELIVLTQGQKSENDKNQRIIFSGEISTRLIYFKSWIRIISKANDIAKDIYRAFITINTITI